MLKVCSSALVLSGVPRFVAYVTEIAKDCGVEVETNESWNERYRLNNDIIICGSKYLSDINTQYYERVRLVLKTTETVNTFVQMGITHFIFDYNNVRELAYSFYIDDQELLSDSSNVSEVIMPIENKHFVMGKYNFNFDTDVYKYAGIGIYLYPMEKVYLAKWLLLGEKDNSKRITLFRLRKRFGKAFLEDIDRKGKWKGKENV